MIFDNLTKQRFEWTGITKSQADTIENTLFNRGHITVAELAKILKPKEEAQVERARENQPVRTAKKTHKV